MAYTFGAATTDLMATNALMLAPFSTQRCTIVTCWVYPTTLTATRILWGCGAVYKLAIDATTTSLRYTNDNTTDGQFTFPAGLAVNTWTWVGLLVNMAGTTVIQVNAWTATPETPPLSRTVTVATAPSGTHLSSGGVFGTGNVTTSPTLSFQGDIGGLCVLSDGTVTTAKTIPRAANGTTTAAELTYIEQAIIHPLWRGDIGPFFGMGLTRNTSDTGGAAGANFYAPLDGGPYVVTPYKAGGRPAPMTTISGATVSTKTTPRPYRLFNNNPLERRTPPVAPPTSVGYWGIRAA